MSNYIAPERMPTAPAPISTQKAWLVDADGHAYEVGVNEADQRAHIAAERIRIAAEDPNARAIADLERRIAALKG